MRVAFLGFGLIGGSIARALHERGAEAELVAWSPSGEGPRRAVAEGVIATAASTPEGALMAADLVVLAGPATACIDLLRLLAAGSLAADPDVTITDVASTKSRLLAAADESELHVVGGHPMAGREIAGYGAADAELFVGRPWVIVPGSRARPEDVARVEWLARATGAQPVRMAAAEHDDAVAAISHLPLLLSAALVTAVTSTQDGERRDDWDAVRRLSASGWRDATRLANGDVEMGAAIAATNAASLARRVRDVRCVLDGWLADLDAAAASDDPDVVPFATRLREARDRLAES